MFFKTYKTTFKRIFRSPLFWMVLGVVAVLVFLNAYRGSYGGGDYSAFGYDPHNGDRDARFILGYHKYHEVITHRLRYMMLFALPCLAAVTVMTVISGDYSDNFYEIERSAGLRASSYFFGRLCAIMTVLFAVALTLSLFSFNYYFFSRGGIKCLTAQTYPGAHVLDYPFTTLWGYLLDSTKVILRLVLLCQMPALLLYTSFTYMVGSYFESGLIAGIGGNAAVIVAYLANNRFQWQYYSFVNKFLLPAKNGVYTYLSRFDTALNSPEFENEMNVGLAGLNKNGYLSDTPEGVIGWLTCMLVLSAAFITVSYVCTRRRRI